MILRYVKEHLTIFKLHRNNHQWAMSEQSHFWSSNFNHICDYITSNSINLNYSTLFRINSEAPHSSTYCFCCAGIEPRASGILGKCFTTELHSHLNNGFQTYSNSKVPLAMDSNGENSSVLWNSNRFHRYEILYYTSATRFFLKCIKN